MPSALPALALTALALASSCRQTASARDTAPPAARCEPAPPPQTAPPEARVTDAPAQMWLRAGDVASAPDGSRWFRAAILWQRVDHEAPVAPAARAVVLALTHPGDAPQFPGCARVAIVADGARVEGASQVRFSPASDGASAEEASLRLTPAAAAPLATARCVAIDVCGTLFPLHALQAARLREFMARVNAEARAPR